jgi:ethanolamine utilization microcompartment shell protein EutS
MTTTDTRTAALGLLMTIMTAMAAVITGDLAVTALSITIGLIRLALAHVRRPRSANLYRARFVVQTWL